MPLIVYLCECKNSTKKYYRQVKDVPAVIICESCGKEARKSLSSPTTSSTVIVDNGVMARQIEVNPEIVKINEERSSKDYRNED